MDDRGRIHFLHEFRQQMNVDSYDECLELWEQKTPFKTIQALFPDIDLSHDNWGSYEEPQQYPIGYMTYAQHNIFNSPSVDSDDEIVGIFTVSFGFILKKKGIIDGREKGLKDFIVIPYDKTIKINDDEKPHFKLFRYEDGKPVYDKYNDLVDSLNHAKHFEVLQCSIYGQDHEVIGRLHNDGRIVSYKTGTKPILYGIINQRGFVPLA